MMTKDGLRAETASIAEELRRISESSPEEPVAADGSRGRPIPPELRERLIRIREAMFQRGIYDPVLGRFDSYTVQQPDLRSIADQLARVAEGLL